MKNEIQTENKPSALKKFWVGVNVIQAPRTVEYVQILVECELDGTALLLGEKKLRALGLKPSGDMTVREFSAVEVSNKVGEIW